MNQHKISGNFIVRLNNLNTAGFDRLPDAKQFVKIKVSEAVDNLFPLDVEINNQKDELCELLVSVSPNPTPDLE